MTTLQDRLAALPEWPNWVGGEVQMSFPANWAEVEPGMYFCIAYHAALARLALARDAIVELREWLAGFPGDYPTKPCIAELDALLKALEGPR